MIENILIVDDDPVIRNFLRDFFMYQKKQVQTCNDGQQAIRLLAKEHFDLVITDMKMPYASGKEVLEFCRKKTTALVIIMTAFGSVENAVEAMQLGAFHYLLKPFTIDALEAVSLKQKNTPS